MAGSFFILWLTTMPDAFVPVFPLKQWINYL